MITALLITWLFIVGIQLIYILFVYSRTAFYHQPKVDSSALAIATEPAGLSAQTQSHQQGLTGRDTVYSPTDIGLDSELNRPGVSVIVCAHNERENLIELLPLLNDQNYPTFEVLVMDDRSTDGTTDFLETGITHLSRVRFIRIDQEHEHVTPKKYALTIALKKARYTVALLTDADCRPISSDWLAGMTAPLLPDTKAITLGFSPYEYRPGLLNLLIRAETLFTAVQYFSLALAGRPYMGVGRNLAYKTDLFFANRGFYTHKNVTGGDDDLFINEVATNRNTAICLAPETFMWSKPKETWSEWRHQKRRHLNVGNYYKSGNKVRLGLLTGSHVLTWVLPLAVGLLVLVYELRQGSFTEREWLLLLTGTGAFTLRLVSFWAIVGRISYRLAHTLPWVSMPFIDLMLAIYYGSAGVKTLFTRRKKRLYWR